jgi:F0F1-type ATP synthase membrane subunit b/b'
VILIHCTIVLRQRLDELKQEAIARAELGVKRKKAKAKAKKDVDVESAGDEGNGEGPSTTL